MPVVLNSDYLCSIIVAPEWLWMLHLKAFHIRMALWVFDNALLFFLQNGRVAQQVQDRFLWHHCPGRHQYKTQVWEVGWGLLASFVSAPVGAVMCVFHKHLCNCVVSLNEPPNGFCHQICCGAFMNYSLFCVWLLMFCLCGCDRLNVEYYRTPRLPSA